MVKTNKCPRCQGIIVIALIISIFILLIINNDAGKRNSCVIFYLKFYCQFCYPDFNHYYNYHPHPLYHHYHHRHHHNHHHHQIIISLKLLVKNIPSSILIYFQLDICLLSLCQYIQRNAAHFRCIFSLQFSLTIAKLKEQRESRKRQALKSFETEDILILCSLLYFIFDFVCGKISSCQMAHYYITINQYNLL